MFEFDTTIAITMQRVEMYLIRDFISIQANVAFIRELRVLLVENMDLRVVLVQMEEARLSAISGIAEVVDIATIELYHYDLTSYQTIFYNLFSGYGFEADIMARIRYAVMWYDWTGSTNIMADFQQMFLDEEY